MLGLFPFLLFSGLPTSLTELSLEAADRRGQMWQNFPKLFGFMAVFPP